MRLHKLVMTGVGPFKDRQEIDFDTLAASGLFLIEGPTGSGKTTIIDAIVYALFGVVSAGSDDVTRMRIRSHYCQDTDPTGVELRFSVDSRQHRVTRVPAGARDPDEPSRAATSKPARQVLTEYRDGEPLVIVQTDDIRRHITGLLGMTAEQFRQLVVLPQGQFAELLRQTPADRLKSLAPLLEDPFIAAVQDDLKRRGEEAQGARDAAGQGVDRAAQQLAGRLHGYVVTPETDFTDSTAPDVARNAAARGILSGIAGEVEVARATQEKHQQDVERLDRAAAQAAEALQVLKDAASAQQAVLDARNTLTSDDADVTEAGIDGRLAGLHQRVGSLEGHAGWESAAEQRAADRADLVERREDGWARIAELREQQAALPALRSELDGRRAAAQSLAAGLEAARREESRWQDLLSKARDLSTLQTSVKRLADDVDTAHQSAGRAQQRERDALAHWQELIQQQRAATAADLAAALEDGQACPVCGSAEHPHPAKAPSPSIPDALVISALEAATQMRSDVAEATDAVTAAATAHANAAAQATALEQALAGATHADLALHAAEAKESTTTAEQAQAELPELTERLELLTSDERALDGQIAEQVTQVAVLDEQLTAHDAAESARAAEIGAAIGEALSATVLLQDTRARIASLETLAEAWQVLAIATAKVADTAVLPVPEAQVRSDTAQAALTGAKAELTSIEQRVTTLASTLNDATPLADAFSGAMAARTQTIERTASAIGLAALVIAQNPRRLQLRSYALQRRFAAVLAAGSMHLSRMSSGKFTFELNDDTAKAGQAGLGIALYDSWTGSTQDPKSLSGGETFYASLALALGLADVIRGEAGGSALETLFVDEGFGSLDQDTLYQVLEQLDHLRTGNRAVGVVSHVTEMKESIPDRIEVRRQADSTSTIVTASAQA